MTAAAITSPGVVPRVSLRVAMLPWSGAGKEDKDFRRILLRVLAVCALISLITPLLPTPKEDREHPEELPPHLAKLLLEREPIPPPPPAPKPERLPEQAVQAGANSRGAQTDTGQDTRRTPRKCTQEGVRRWTAGDEG